jgi:predicted SAM-dependent methyltransferase
MWLNLGCGNNKISECTNVDCNPDLNPDLCFDLRKPFPLDDEVAEGIYLFHTIEHLENKYHIPLLLEIHRVLAKDGTLIISYPEFGKILQNWLDNKRGRRDFWEATIYGRQSSPSDFHVSAMDTTQFIDMLCETGFKDINSKPEPVETFNTIVRCTKGEPMKTYEEVLFDEIFT